MHETRAASTAAQSQPHRSTVSKLRSSSATRAAATTSGSREAGTTSVPPVSRACIQTCIPAQRVAS